jgi:polyphosphate kinase
MTAVDLVVDSFRRTPQGVGHSERTRQELLAALAEANLLDGLGGLGIREFDEDEVLLVGPDGDEVQTWQQDYPYQQRMSREEYVGVKRDLQIELLKMQSWVKDAGQRVVVLFEGQGDAQSRLCWSSSCLTDSRRVGLVIVESWVRVDLPRPWRR